MWRNAKEKGAPLAARPLQLWSPLGLSAGVLCLLDAPVAWCRLRLAPALLDQLFVEVILRREASRLHSTRLWLLVLLAHWRPLVLRDLAVVLLRLLGLIGPDDLAAVGLTMDDTLGRPVCIAVVLPTRMILLLVGHYNLQT